MEVARVAAENQVGAAGHGEGGVDVEKEGRANVGVRVLAARGNLVRPVV
jgi:hypothetical protein